MDFANKVAVITGGASGIGLGTAKKLLEKGAIVILADIEIEQAKLQQQLLGDRAYAKHLDVRSWQSFQDLNQWLIDHFDTIDILINNAGVAHSGTSLFDVNHQTAEWTIDINFTGIIRGIATIGKTMRDRGTECIIANVSSEHGLGFPNAGNATYNGTKHAVVGLSDVLRHEAPDHMQINVIFPGIVNTNIGDAERFRPDIKTDPKRKTLAKKVMARGMTPDHAGALIVAGLERGDFYIPLHAHIYRYAETRWLEIKETFDQNMPYTAESEKYDVGNLVRTVLNELKTTKQ